MYFDQSNMFDTISLAQFGHTLWCELAYVFAISQIVFYSYSKVIYKSDRYDWW